MKKLRFAAICFFVLIGATKAMSQEVDSTAIKGEMIAFYSKKLSIDNDKAKKVFEIQDNYKRKVEVIMAERGLSDQDRRAKIDLLIDEKNEQLGTLLSLTQLAEVVPSTERDRIKSPEGGQPQKESPKRDGLPVK